MKHIRKKNKTYKIIFLGLFLIFFYYLNNNFTPNLNTILIQDNILETGTEIKLFFCPKDN